MPAKSQKTPNNQNTQKLDKWFALVVRVFVLAIFVVHPLILMPDTYYSIVDTKRMFFTVMLIGVTLCLLVLALMANSMAPGYHKWPGFRSLIKNVRAYEWALFAYFLVMVISTIFAAYPRQALLGSQHNNAGLLMQSAYLLTAVIVGRLYRPRETDLLALCGAATVVSVIGIFQYYGMDFLGLYPKALGTPVGREIVFLSTMSNRNIVSTYLCLAFCICVVLFAQYSRRIHWAYLPMAWIIFYTLIIGDSESGYVGIAVALLVLFPLIAKTRKCTGRLLFLFAGCVFFLWTIGVTFAGLGWDFFFEAFQPLFLPVAILLAGLGAVLFFVKLPPLPKRFYRMGWYGLVVVAMVAALALLPRLAASTGNSTLVQAAEVLQGNIDDNFGSNRVFIWRRSLQMAADRPVIGHGPDNFYPVFDSRFGPEGLDKYGDQYLNAHNEYLQFLTDTGILGLLAMLAFYGFVFYGAAKKTGQPMGLAVLFAMVCFVVQAFFNFGTPLAHPVVWVLWGVFLARSFYLRH